MEGTRSIHELKDAINSIVILIVLGIKENFGNFGWSKK
jgi:hypothetical protein